MNTSFIPRIIITLMVIFHLILGFFYSVNQNIDNSSEGYAMLSAGAYNHYSRQTLDLTGDSLKTVMVSAPMNLWESPYAPILVMLLLRLIAFYILYRELSRLFHPSTMVWFSMLFLLSPWLLYNSFLGADAYIQLGVAGYLVSIMRLTRSDIPRSSSFLWTTVNVFSMLWCMALTPAFALLLMTTVFLWIRKTIHLNVSGLITSLAVIAVVMVPYIKQLQLNDDPVYMNHSQHYPAYNLVLFYPLFKGLIYWMRYGTTVFQNDILFNTDFSWISDSHNTAAICKYIWYFVLIITGIITLMINLAANYLMLKEVKQVFFRNFSEKQQLLYLEIICAVMLIAIVVYIAVTPYTLYNNTLSVCFVFSLIPLLCMIEKFSGVSITGHLKWIIPVSIFLITVNGLAAIKSGCYDINNNYDAVSEDIISQSFN